MRFHPCQATRRAVEQRRGCDVLKIKLLLEFHTYSIRLSCRLYHNTTVETFPTKLKIKIDSGSTLDSITLNTIRDNRLGDLCVQGFVAFTPRR